MDDLSQIESAVRAAQDSSNPQLQQDAVTFLNSIHASPEAWKAGMNLLTNSSDNVAKMFGVNLLRATLSSDNAVSSDLNSVGYIRSGIWDILRAVVADDSTSAACPPYILSGIVGVLILCVKLEYPHQWPSAFSDILSLSASGWSGIQVAVKMILEFDTEFVDSTYCDSRTETDTRHISRVKDDMRNSGIVTEIVGFLCQVAPQARSNNNVDLCQSSLGALSRLISWVDIEMFIEKGLPTVYEAIKDVNIRSSSFACLQEVVKKGMEPFQKFQLLDSIKLFDAISQVPITLEDDDETGLAELGELLNETLTLLLGCWSSVQSNLILSTQQNKPYDGEKINYYAAISGYLTMLLQSIAIPLFSHPDIDVFRSMVPSFKILISLLKSQTDQRGLIEGLLTTYPHFFSAAEYVDPLLVVISKVIQYPEDFSLIQDDDDADIIDAIDEVKKLFVNIVKVAPNAALAAVSSLLQSLPQPFSQAPFQTLESALRMLHSFGDGMSSREFPSFQALFIPIIKAVHSTDVANHQNPYVLLQYFELTQRYFKFIDDDQVLDIIRVLLGPQGLRHSHPMLNNRCAYLFLNIVKDSLKSKSVALLPIIPIFSDMILVDIGSHGIIKPVSESYLLEAISHIIFSDDDKTEAIRTQQNQLLQEMSSILVTHLNQLATSPILADPSHENYGELIEVIEHKISSISCIATKFEYGKRPDMGVVFAFCGNTIISLCREVGTGQKSEKVNEKALQFFRSMIMAVNIESLENVRDIIALTLQNSSSDQTVNSCFVLFDFCLATFDYNAYPLVQLHFQSLFQKNDQILALTLQEAGILDASFAEVSGLDVTLISGLEVRSQSLQMHPLKTLKDSADKNCVGAFNMSEESIELAFSIIKNGITGGRYINDYSLKVPLRKAAVAAMVSLCRLTQRYFQEKAQNEAVAASKFPGLDVPFLQRIIAWTINDGLDLLFQACIDRQSINPRDAMTSTLFDLFGLLLYLLNSIDSKTTSDKLISLFQAQGWPSDKANTLYALVQAGNLTERQFQDQFKTFMVAL